MKERKTITQYVIVGNYGYGQWDFISSADTLTEARADLKCYRENDKSATFKLKKCYFKKDKDLYSQMYERNYR